MCRVSPTRPSRGGRACVRTPAARVERRSCDDGGARIRSRCAATRAAPQARRHPQTGAREPCRGDRRRDPRDHPGLRASARRPVREVDPRRGRVRDHAVRRADRRPVGVEGAVARGPPPAGPERDARRPQSRHAAVRLPRRRAGLVAAHHARRTSCRAFVDGDVPARRRDAGVHGRARLGRPRRLPGGQGPHRGRAGHLAPQAAPAGAGGPARAREGDRRTGAADRLAGAHGRDPGGGVPDQRHRPGPPPRRARLRRAGRTRRRGG